MAVLKGGKSQYPFWGASVNLITGLDPLGLQTTSEATYAAMLPGISNLTNRLRYYGFYCWLLSFYFSKEKKGNSEEQYKFIRRAELMIAILMHSERAEVQQITGSRFAGGMIDTTENSFYDLAYGADKDGTSKAVYWKYPSGAFGQYYYGAMQVLSLVIAAINDDGDVIYMLTDPNERQKVSGKELGKAFDKELPTEIKDLFYTSIKKGKLYKKDVEHLIEYFYIDTVDPATAEWDLYVQMLLDRDEPAVEVEEHFTFHRKETIQYLLRFASSNEDEYNWYAYLLDCYRKKIGTDESRPSDTEIGWYCYQLNEYWQFACGTVFWGVLQYLYNLQSEQYLPSLIDNISGKAFKRMEPKLAADDVLLQDTIKQAAARNEEDIVTGIDTTSAGDPINAIADGLTLLFKVYSANKENLPFLKDYMKRLHVERDGNMVDGLLLIHQSEQKRLMSFLKEFILRNIVYRHQLVALRKMGNGTQSTQKFIIEEQYIRLIDTFPPRNTSPRMNALRNILFDLRVIDDEGYLTDLSNQLV